MTTAGGTPSESTVHTGCLGAVAPAERAAVETGCDGKEKFTSSQQLSQHKGSHQLKAPPITSQSQQKRRRTSVSGPAFLIRDNNSEDDSGVPNGVRRASTGSVGSHGHASEIKTDSERVVKAKMSAWTKVDEMRMLDAIETQLKGRWGTIAQDVGPHRQAQGCVVHWGSLRRKLGMEMGKRSIKTVQTDGNSDDEDDDKDWKEGRSKLEGMKNKRRGRTGR
ncbi:hypothetical protein HDU93_004380 [Gonapodya sp. JEL0774]|nr:hypothetical protein HDU93_004380 [Gonapodya sp. JEL0774]